ncbi:MAG: DUF4197 domain-containing protein [Gammaproteobacteria bacterium]|nr:DUF4197 domain-containing protein [Gammaproteobacteria bacterium]
MHVYKSIAVLIVFSIGITSVSHAGWRDWLNNVVGGDDKSSISRTTPVTSLSQNDVIKGLKEALSKGAQYAVGYLGKDNGFLGDARVKIPMPRNLRRIESTLRSLGAEKYADEFVATMNHAAEKAMVEAIPIFTSAIKSMSVDDGMKILKGPDDAATRYFRDKTHTQLSEKMLPITRQATNKAGVTSAYKRMVDKLGFARSLLGDDMVDIDQYVTNKALDGLFLMIAEEEKKIRENPVARTTDILKKVFSSIK